MENEETLISAIVPVYNGQDYLEKCIQSILDQTYKNVEIIIVNDGSTDRTGEICERLQAEHGCIRVITLGDDGVSAARNAGMDAAKGEILTFVDADDRLHREMFRRLYDCMERTGSDVVGCRFFSWSGEADWQQAAAAQGTTEQVEVYEADRYLREAVLQGNSRCWSKLYRCRVVNQVRFIEGLSIGEDMLFLLKMLPFVEKIAESDFQGYGYYQNPAGAIRRKFTPAYMDQITCWEMARELIVKQDGSLSAQADAQIMVAIMLVVGKISLLAGQERRMAEEYVKVCEKKLKKLAKEQASYAYLPSGYGIKVRMFACLPRLYLWLYRLQKNGKEKHV